MNCKISGEYIMKYFDGNCSDAEYKELEQHMAECENCRDEFEKLSDVFIVLGEDGMLEPPGNFEIEVMKKVDSIEFAGGTDRRFVAFVYGIAASMIFALSIALLFEARSMDIFEFIQKIYSFSAFVSGMGMALKSIGFVMLELVSGFLSIFLQTALTIIKNYYHILVILLLMALAVQKTMASLNRQEGGLQK